MLESRLGKPIEAYADLFLVRQRWCRARSTPRLEQAALPLNEWLVSDFGSKHRC